MNDYNAIKNGVTTDANIAKFSEYKDIQLGIVENASLGTLHDIKDSSNDGGRNRGRVNEFFSKYGILNSQGVSSNTDSVGLFGNAENNNDHENDNGGRGLFGNPKPVNNSNGGGGLFGNSNQGNNSNGGGNLFGNPNLGNNSNSGGGLFKNPNPINNISETQPREGGLFGSNSQVIPNINAPNNTENQSRSGFFSTTNNTPSDNDTSVNIQETKNIEENIKMAEESMIPSPPPIGYTISPTYPSLCRMTRKQLSKVKNFTISNQFVKVIFDGETDLRHVNLERDVYFSRKQAHFYRNSNSRNKPKIGQKLNKPAKIIFSKFGIPTHNFEDFRSKLFENCRLKDIKLLKMNNQTDTVILLVNHF